MKLFENRDEILSNDGYNTIDMHTRGDKIILITNPESLKNFRDDIYNKWKCSSYAIFLLLIMQLFVHSYLSYNDLMDCELKINTFNQINTRVDKSSKEITFICASYLMHIFFMIGYFFLAFFTIFKQNNVGFLVFEIYLVIMIISDFFFSFINP